MTAYVEEQADGTVIQIIGLPDIGGVGPPAPCPVNNPGCTYHRIDQLPNVGPPPSQTSALKWNDGAPSWVETVPLVDLITQVLEKIDADADAARVSVLIKTTKAEEYMQAETQARAWKESGYAGDAPSDVASWAAAKWREEMTDQQAAESILAQADQYRTLLSGIRALRLKHMEDARHAVDAAGAWAVLGAFTTDLSNLMKGPA